MSLLRNVERISRFYSICIKGTDRSDGSECRFLARDFHFSTEEAAKQQQELELAGTIEKELWVRKS